MILEGHFIDCITIYEMSRCFFYEIFGGKYVLKSRLWIKYIYIVTIIVFSVGLLVVSPTATYKIISMLLLLLLLFSYRLKAKMCTGTYEIMAVVLILHHILLFALEAYQSVDAGEITPFIVFSGVFYAPILSDVFTPILAVLTLIYHFWIYNDGNSFAVAGIKTFNAILTAVLATVGVHLFRVLSVEHERFYKASITDRLTELYNFTHTMKLGQEFVDKGTNFIVVLIDIDDFKDINDTYGHFVGNKVLVQISTILKKLVGDDGIVGRLGGDEFVIIIQQETEQGQHIIELLEQLQCQNYITDPELVPVNIGFSYGIAFQEKKAFGSIQDVMKSADKEMYNNKISKKSGVKSYDFEGVSPVEFHDLLNTLSQKDMYTLIHSLYVARYGAMLAESFGLQADQVKEIWIAGWLHDIGKIVIPNEILRKPASLDDDEYSLMKKHVIYGFDLLKSFQLKDNVLRMVAEHHEKYDGTGYPYQCAGEQISIGGRILAIVDSYSAMTIKRVYRLHQLSKEEALEELILQKGKQFDPHLVEKFVDLMTSGGVFTVKDYAKE